MPGSATRANALDHVVVVLFENRSLDNVLGRLYGPGDGKAFEGVIGKELSNPIPGWAEHGSGREVVPYGVATDMDSPNPDSGEEWYHTNTQLFGAIDDHNRFKIGEGVTAPWNAPPPGAVPAMDGFVADYISTFTGEVGRQPAYEEYAQIMTGYTPEQLPVLSGIAREFGVFDHWFSEVPSQTFMNRSFWTAATSSGLVVNSPVRKWFTENDAETIFERLEQHGRTWKVYVMEPMCLSFTGVIHYPRLKDRLATHFVRFSEFEKDAAAGTLPDFSLIEPDMIAGVATETLELLLAVPDLDVLYVPIGAGSGAAGACIVGRALRGPQLSIVGVQSTGAPAVYESWRAGALLELPRKGTIAAGLDSRVAFELPLAILTRNVDAIVLVEDGEIIAGMRLLFEACRQVAEPAGAAAMAAAYKLRQQHQGRKVGIILSGGNVDPDMFRRALAV